MSYSSPSNDLDSEEICSFLSMTNKMGLPELIKHVWKAGYDWGFQCGYEDGKWENE